ncbi:MAG: methionine--tRNA ligase subunit beta, partial [Pirellulales bacterium]
ADSANPFVEQNKPWELRKDPQQEGRLQDVCTIALNLFRQLAIYLAPVLPKLAEQCGELLGAPIEKWNESKEPLTGTPVAKFTHMIRRIDLAKVQAMIDESKEDAATVTDAQSRDSGEALEAEPLADECTIDDFMKVDLRVARVLSAERVPEARKLLKLTLGLGGDEVRTVFAGIKAAYEPEALVGRLVVCVANLAPRKMKFGTSESMVVASGPGGADVFILSPDEGAVPGQRVH